MKKLAIIGANGYVGAHLTAAMAGEYEVTAIVRDKDSICRQINGVKYCLITDMLPKFDIIINTAYALHKQHKQCASENAEMLKKLKQISAQHTLIIHLSSLAVFGFGLDMDIKPDAVATGNDFSYVYSKRDMENKLLNAFERNKLSIIRLGNIWGPGNTSYTQPIIDSLLWNLPVLSTSHAYSNLTHIQNIVSYIAHIAKSSQHLTFHHLAEWSHISWHDIIMKMAEILGAEPKQLPHPPFYPLSPADELNHLMKQPLLKAIKLLRNGRFTSSYFPEHIFRNLYNRSHIGIHNSKPVLLSYHVADTLQWILHSKIQFTNHWADGWTPQLNWEDSFTQLKVWMKQSGYLIRQDIS